MSHADLILASRLGVGFVVSFIFGFERQLRGAPAGDRTFALIGLASTAITAVAAPSSPQTIAGIVTGVGFIGAGVIFRSEGGMIRGITTAATIFATTATGIVIGYGHLMLGVITAAAVLFLLELQHIPGLRAVDADRWASHFRNDTQPPES